MQASPLSTRHDPLCPIVILGPTAGGKTDLSIKLAQALDGEVIGADSMQVYQHLDAGTAKPTPQQRQQVPHHLFDMVSPTERFTVHDWLAAAQTAISDIQSRNKRPIIVGGTNLYLKALLEGLMDGPGQDPAYRQSLELLEDSQLHNQLSTIDPKAAQRIHINDRKRLIRALEVFHVSGKPISHWQTQWATPATAPGSTPTPRNNTAPKNNTDSERDNTEIATSSGITQDAPSASPTDAILIGLRWAPEDINPRINLRVKAMFYPDKVEPELAQAVCIGGEDLIAETKRLEAAGLLGQQAREALGYKQVLQLLCGNWDEQTAFEKTKILTRRFAKQQRTWLKRFSQVHWIDMPHQDSTHALQSTLSHVQQVTSTSEN